MFVWFLVHPVSIDLNDSRTRCVTSSVQHNEGVMCSIRIIERSCSVAHSIPDPSPFPRTPSSSRMPHHAPSSLHPSSDPPCTLLRAFVPRSAFPSPKCIHVDFDTLIRDSIPWRILIWKYTGPCDCLSENSGRSSVAAENAKPFVLKHFFVQSEYFGCPLTGYLKI